MRSFALVVSLALSGCAAGGGTYQPPESVVAEFDRRTAALRASNPELFTGRPIGAPPTAEERQKMEADRAKRAREDELLERALTNSPDYMAALRRAAIANVDVDEPPAPSGRRNRAAEAQAREQRITAEETRLSDEIEKRRRTRLAAEDQRQRSIRDQAAIDACQARGQAIEASMFDRRSILNLEGAIYGAQARDACIQNYMATR
jgi:hypothetical protein